MSSEHDNASPDELTAVQQALAALAPAPPRLDRDRLMFLAGVASASGGHEPTGIVGLPLSPEVQNRGVTGKLTLPARVAWPASSAVLAATSLALALALVARPVSPVQIVYRDRPASTVAPVTATPTQPQQPLVAALPVDQSPIAIPAENYVRTRDVALRLGLDALGGGPGSGGQFTPAPTYRSLLESFLPPREAPASPSSQSTQM